MKVIEQYITVVLLINMLYEVGLSFETLGDM